MCYGQILESGLRKARKKHICTGCRRPIRVGREYEYVQGVDHGDFWRSKWHKRCLAVADVAEPFDMDGCMIAEPRDIALDYAREDGWRNLLAKARASLSSRFGRGPAAPQEGE